MVASQAVMTETPESVVREMSEHMEALADAGDWVEVESLVVRLRSALLNVPEAQRHILLQLVRRSTDKIAMQAKSAKNDVTGQISSIRRGRKATEAYELA
jgi:hypothetical protein